VSPLINGINADGFIGYPASSLNPMKARADLRQGCFAPFHVPNFHTFCRFPSLILRLAAIFPLLSAMPVHENLPEHTLCTPSRSKEQEQNKL
jgi:hypothetical protein